MATLRESMILIRDAAARNLLVLDEIEQETTSQVEAISAMPPGSAARQEVLDQLKRQLGVVRRFRGHATMIRDNAAEEAEALDPDTPLPPIVVNPGGGGCGPVTDLLTAYILAKS